MIVEGIFEVLFLFVEMLISLIPAYEVTPSWFNYFADMLSVSLVVFPFDVWIALISFAFVWNGILTGWALVEWLYKKIPGVD